MHLISACCVSGAPGVPEALWECWSEFGRSTELGNHTRCARCHEGEHYPCRKFCGWRSWTPNVSRTRILNSKAACRSQLICIRSFIVGRRYLGPSLMEEVRTDTTCEDRKSRLEEGGRNRWRKVVEDWGCSRLQSIPFIRYPPKYLLPTRQTL